MLLLRPGDVLERFVGLLLGDLDLVRVFLGFSASLLFVAGVFFRFLIFSLRSSSAIEVFVTYLVNELDLEAG